MSKTYILLAILLFLALPLAEGEGIGHFICVIGGFFVGLSLAQKENK